MALISTLESEEVKQLNEAIRKIILLTQQDIVKWEAENLTEKLLESGALSSYKAVFSGHPIRLMQQRPKPEIGSLGSMPGMAPYRREIITSLAMLDSSDHPVFYFPLSPELTELQRVVNSQLADINGFLKALNEAVRAS